MPRPCAVEAHVRGYQTATESSEMPRPCAVEFSRLMLLVNKLAVGQQLT